jgi:hypothetical protein
MVIVISESTEFVKMAARRPHSAVVRLKMVRIGCNKSHGLPVSEMMNLLHAPTLGEGVTNLLKVNTSKC